MTNRIENGVFEYKSAASLFGLPIVHVNMGGMADGRPRPGVARGWIAIGGIAHGVVAGVGGVATGCIALGGLSFGAVALGGLAVAGLAVGGLAAGWWAIGGLAAGWYAIGGLALGWKAAIGGAAFANDFAIGGAASAAHANDQAAKEFFATTRFFSAGRAAMKQSQWALILLLLPIILPWLRRRQEGKGY